MKLARVFPVFLALLFSTVTTKAASYEATWESLDSRPLPKWYDEAKLGIFIHWGVFSVPAYGSEWFWYQWQDRQLPDFVDFVKATEPPRFAYADYAKRFDATLYRPEYWADVFARSGAQYVVLTSKHHEGFCNWDSRKGVPSSFNWNALDVGPRRDILGDLAKAVRNVSSPQTSKSLKFGVYHSLLEWFNPMYLHDEATNWTTQSFVDQKVLPALYDLVEKYEPELLWSDGAWTASSQYWKATEFLAWVANNSTVASTIVWNDRWGTDSTCKHGSYWTCKDNYRPDDVVPRKWENCATVAKTSWGFDRNATIEGYYTTKELIDELIQTVALGGNMLLNVGPSADGTISPIFVDRLLGVGDWLGVNGDAIYGTKVWSVAQNETDSDVYYTAKDSAFTSPVSTLYVHLLKWPEDNTVKLRFPIPTNNTVIQMLGLPSSTPMKWHYKPSDGLLIQLPLLTPYNIPCLHSWVLSMAGIENAKPEEPKMFV